VRRESHDGDSIALLANAAVQAIAAAEAGGAHDDVTTCRRPNSLGHSGRQKDHDGRDSERGISIGLGKRLRAQVDSEADLVGPLDSNAVRWRGRVVGVGKPAPPLVRKRQLDEQLFVDHAWRGRCQISCLVVSPQRVSTQRGDLLQQLVEAAAAPSFRDSSPVKRQRPAVGIAAVVLEAAAGWTGVRTRRGDRHRAGLGVAADAREVICESRR